MEHTVRTRRYDLWRGGFRDRGYEYGNIWLPNGQEAQTASTEADLQGVGMGIEGEEAPVVSLSWPTSQRASRVYRSQLFEREPFRGVTLSQNRRQLLVYSMRFRRTYALRSGRLLSRQPLPPTIVQGEYHVGFCPSPDGRWILARENAVRLYDAHNKLLRQFPADRQMSMDNTPIWLSPTIFYLIRGLDNRDQVGSVEFYDARTLRRVWVLSGFMARERSITDSGRTEFETNPRFYPLIAQPNAVIVCGKFLWTWRDARSGKVLRQARAPHDRGLNSENLAYGSVEVHGSSYYWLTPAGNIWRNRFRFL